MSEQEIIAQYFSHHQFCDNVDIGIGDDAAVVTPPINSKLVITTDTLNEGVHFHPNCLPEHIGHKSLAVNLSDLAAMGATPLWATMNLSVPTISHDWFKNFSQGFFALASQHNVKLIGGDLVRGPLSISIQVIGYLSSKKVLTRAKAETDDLIFVSGTVGDAALGLKIQDSLKDLDLSQEDKDYVAKRFNTPEPRINLALGLVKFANAAIDISDGLLIDLQRILSSSNVGAVINIDQLPLSKVGQKLIKSEKDWSLPLVGGDDYEIIFTANKRYTNEINQLSSAVGCPISVIGKIVQDEHLTLLLRGNLFTFSNKLGFEHFA